MSNFTWVILVMLREYITHCYNTFSLCVVSNVESLNSSIFVVILKLTIFDSMSLKVVLDKVLWDFKEEFQKSILYFVKRSLLMIFSRFLYKRFPLNKTFREFSFPLCLFSLLLSFFFHFIPDCFWAILMWYTWHSEGYFWGTTTPKFRFKIAKVESKLNISNKILKKRKESRE